jgi:DnaJ family protein A protein 2
MDYYKILQLDTNCTLEDIKKAYHRLAHIHHPDKGGDVREFIKIKDAYEYLMKNHTQQNDHYTNVSNINGDGTHIVYDTVWYY